MGRVDRYLTHSEVSKDRPVPIALAIIQADAKHRNQKYVSDDGIQPTHFMPPTAALACAFIRLRRFGAAD